MADGATPPTQCGLAIALPLDQRTVELALEGGPFRDYVSRAGRSVDASTAWRDTFSSVAAAVTRLATVAEGMGVTLAMNASLHDLSKLFDRCSVVTILAHWRGPGVVSADLRLTSRALMDRIETETSEIATLVRTGLPANWKQMLGGCPTEKRRLSMLAEQLDARLDCEPYLGGQPYGVPVQMDASTLRHENRVVLQEWWPEAFAPGCRLELADGLYASNDVADCVPESWTGVCDLSNCQSAQLIDRIKRNRGDRIVIGNDGLTDPLTRCAILEQAYRLLAANPCNYAAARAALATSLRGQRRQDKTWRWPWRR